MTEHRQVEAVLDARWHRLTQYRWECAECGDYRVVAVVPWHGDRLRLCHSCFLDGWWRKHPAKVGAE